MRRVARVLAVAAILAAGCAPKALVRVPRGPPLDPAPLAARLAAYNEGPTEVRAQGRLRVEGQGTADFGARVEAGVGLRLDAVAGPFATPVFALACRQGVECRAYVPSRRTVYVDPSGAWGEWLGAFLRGRVPRVGPASAAWTGPDGAPVLLLADAAGWDEEVVFAPDGRVPARLIFSRDGRAEMEVTYGAYREVGGRPFPARVTLRVEKPRTVCEFDFRRIEPDARGVGDALILAVPPGTAVEELGGSPTWNATGIPFWPTRPDG